MGTYRRIEHPLFQAYDSNGDPLSGGLVYTYAAGTDTPKATYQEDDTENANPVVLDTTGRAEIYGTGYYKFVLKDSDGVTIWTLDNVQGIGETGVVSIGDYAGDFDAAITAIGATETTLYVDSAATMSAAVTVPATCTVIVQKGGSIDQGGNALTFNGPLIMQGGTITNDAALTINHILSSEPYEIFTSSTGTVTFGDGYVTKLYPQWWGAIADGTTDATTAIQEAITAWITMARGTLFFPPGDYIISDELLLTLPATTDSMLFSGYGATFSCGTTIDSGNGYMMKITHTAGTLVRNVTFEGFRLAATANNFGGIEVDGQATGYLYRIVFRDVAIYDVSRHGIYLTGNFFESQFYSVRIVIDTTESSYYGIYMHEAAGDISSLDFYGCEISGGKHNIYMDSPGESLKIYGGTFLLSGAESIKVGTSGVLEFTIYGAHFENAWSGASAVASASFAAATNQAFINANGVITISGCDFISSTDTNRYAVRLYTTASAVLTNLYADGNDFEYLVRAEGSAAGKITIIGGYAASTGLTSLVHNYLTSVNFQVIGARGYGDYQMPYAITSTDATPSVAGGNLFYSAGTTAITDFDDGVEGQVITFIAKTSITITDGTNIFLSGSANWAMTASDTLTLVCISDGTWYEVSRGDNGA